MTASRPAADPRGLHPPGGFRAPGARKGLGMEPRLCHVLETGRKGPGRAGAQSPAPTRTQSRSCSRKDRGRSCGDSPAGSVSEATCSSHTTLIQGPL